MKKSASTPLLSIAITLACLLIATLGYVYTHKPFTAETLTGLLVATWQIVTAGFIIILAGGIGEGLLKPDHLRGWTRTGLDLALGIGILSAATLIVGSILGTGLLPLSILLVTAGFLFRTPIATWLRQVTANRLVLTGKFAFAIASMSVLVFIMHFGQALAPVTMFDTLVYHYALPKAYLQLGQIQYLPDNMFSGMPQNAEMLYLLAMRFAGAESATVLSLLVGLAATLAILGFVTERFGAIAGWTAVAALLAGESFTKSLSSGYVEWMVILFGWAAIAALDYWRETQDRKLLLLCGMVCGAAIGTKYTAGVILLGCLAILALLPENQGWKERLSNMFVIGGVAVLSSLPWWIKNYLTTGNPFYPFFFPAGAMNEFRLFHYQNVPVWGNWRSVILLPWQATIWGAEAKEGFSASIGAILIGLSPLVWIGWKSRSEVQKSSIKIAAILTLVGFAIWAVGSRLSGLLIQSRLYFGMFPGWALLAGVGMDSVWELRAWQVRFGRVAGVLVLLMLGFNVLATSTEFILRNPLAYVLRQEGGGRYLARNMGMYAEAMETIQSLPASSRVLMLWETRGFACWPRCDSDEVIDRWYDDFHFYREPELVLSAWKDQGYTHLLVYQAGADFVRASDPRPESEDWQALERLLSQLPPPTMIGRYALYTLNNPGQK